MKVDQPRSASQIRALAIRHQYRMGPGVVAVGLFVLTVALLRLERGAIDEELMLWLQLVAFFGIGILGFLALLAAHILEYGYWRGILPGSTREALSFACVWGCVSVPMTVTLIYGSGPYVQMASVLALAAWAWALRYERRTGRPWLHIWALTSLVMAMYIMQFESATLLWQPLADGLLLALGAAMTLFGLLEEVLTRRAHRVRLED